MITEAPLTGATTDPHAPPGTRLASTSSTSRVSPPSTPTSTPSCGGTHAGLAHPAAVEHLHRLGVTAVELLPVHQFAHDHYLVERGLRNYWGYGSISFLAPTTATPPAASPASR